MAVEVKVPAAGESITEVLVAEWLKAEGDTVSVDEPLVTLETDKATLDLPSPAAGVLARIVTPRGQVARVGQVIAILEEVAAGARPGAGAAPPAARREPGAAPAGDDRQRGGAAARREEQPAARGGGPAAARRAAEPAARGGEPAGTPQEETPQEEERPAARGAAPAAARREQERPAAPGAAEPPATRRAEESPAARTGAGRGERAAPARDERDVPAARGPAADAVPSDAAGAPAPTSRRGPHERTGGDARAREADSISPGAPHVMPAAQRLLEQHGLAEEDVTPTGPGGRLLKEDVLRHLEGLEMEAPADTEDVPATRAGRAPAPEGRAAAPPAPRAPAAPARAAPDGGREEEAVPMTMLRRRIAERLVQAQQAAALLTTFNEIDMSAVMALRKAHQDAFQQRHQVKLGFMSFFVRAVIEGLKLIPALNAEIRGTDIVYRHYHDIGIAVGGGRGLVVPVLRNAEQLSFAETERAIADFARRAEANQLTLEELQGGTFTISNGGIYGSLLSTPIVNPPQSGILGLHVIQDRPVARDGQVVIRPMMYVALTYDHRIVDGREAVTFLRHVKACLEDPARILLEI